MKLWKHKQSGIWRVRFTIGGKRVQVSLKTTAKGEAEALALRAVEDAKTRAQGREPVQAVAKVQAAILESLQWRGIPAVAVDARRRKLTLWRSKLIPNPAENR